MPEPFNYQNWLQDIDRLQSEITQYQIMLKLKPQHVQTTLNQIAWRQFLIINQLIIQATIDVMTYNGNQNQIKVVHQRPVIIQTPAHPKQQYVTAIQKTWDQLLTKWQRHLNPNQIIPPLFLNRQLSHLITLNPPNIAQMLTVIIQQKLLLPNITNQPLPKVVKMFNYRKQQHFIATGHPDRMVDQILDWLLLIRHCQNWLQKRLIKQFQYYDRSIIPNEVKMIFKHDFDLNL